MARSIKPYYVLAHEDAATRGKMLALCRERSSAIGFIVVCVTLVLYGGGLALIVQPGVWLPLLGTCSLSLSMVVSWYLSHDCAHLSVFRGKKANVLLGEALSWINGISYFRFEQYRADHLRHHSEHVDLIGVDMKAFLRRLPAPVGRFLLFLEDCYVPVMFFAIKAQGFLSILRGPDHAYRVRVVLVLLASVGFLSWLASLSWAAVLWYFLAAGVRIHCVRFVDVFQHSYLQVDPALPSPPKGKSYEQENTFSFPVAYRLKFLNVIILNFGFHSAHHAMPGCPWYNLARLNDLVMAFNGIKSSEAYGAPVKFLDLVRAYHKNLGSRITSENEGEAYDAGQHFSLENFTGAFTDKLLG